MKPVATRARASSLLREDIVKDGPCAVSFSRGKDAIAATIAMIESGGDVELFHLDPGPKLRLVEESIDYFERAFGKKIARIPHPSFYRWVHEQVFRAPEQRLAVEACALWDVDWTYEDAEIAARAELGVSANSWICDGVRSADSPVRHAYVIRTGGVNAKRRKASVVHDWKAQDVDDAIRRFGLKLPVDYLLFGRTFDGIDARFAMALRDSDYRDDFDVLLEAFPLLEADIFRHEKGWL